MPQVWPRGDGEEERDHREAQAGADAVANLPVRLLPVFVAQTGVKLRACP